MNTTTNKPVQEIFAWITPIGGSRFKVVPVDLEREEEPACPAGLRYAVGVLTKDAVRLCDSVDSTATGYNTRAVRKALKRGDIDTAGMEAVRLRASVSRQVDKIRRQGREPEEWRLHQLQAVGELADRIVLCAALRLAGDDIDTAMASVKAKWSLKIEEADHAERHE